MARRLAIDVLLATIVTGVAAPHPAAAHAFSVSYAQFTVQDRGVDVIVRVPLDDVDLLLRLDRDLDGTVSSSELEAARDRVDAYLTRHLTLIADGARLKSHPSRLSIWHDPVGARYLESRATFAATARIATISIRSGLLTDLYPSHKTLGEVSLAGRSETFVFESGRTYEGRVRGPGAWPTALSFVRLGVEHIFTGYDHILFLFALLLIGTTLRSLVAIVTSFTVAHSITLALATLRVVTPVPWTIEAAIALSIAYIGIENIFSRDPKHRWKITFLFGLVHGFGFAAVLRDLNLARSSVASSLFGFNVGVEMGQVTIVCLMYPVLRWVTRSPYRVPVVRFASSAIALAGLIWFYQRIP